MKRTPNIRRFSIVLASVAFAILVLIIDHNLGPFIRLPILFVLPVAATSWYSGLFAGLTMAIGLPLARLIVESDIPKPWGLTDSAINTTVIILTMALISFLIHYIRRQNAQIKILEGFLPICSFCKKIRTTEQQWEQMESYITRHSQAEFSHGVCPECAQKHYGIDVDQMRDAASQPTPSFLTKQSQCRAFARKGVSVQIQSP
jgi:hypothetical protein